MDNIKARQRTIPKVQLPQINKIIDQAVKDSADKAEMLRRIQAERILINERQLRFILKKRGPGPNCRRTCPLKALLARDPDAARIIRKIEYAMACTDSTTAFCEAAQLLRKWLEAPQVPAEGRLMLFMACCRSARTEDEVQELQELCDQIRKKVDPVCQDRKLFRVLFRDQLEILRVSDSNRPATEHTDDDTLAADDQPYALEIYGVHCNLALLLLLTRMHVFRNFLKGVYFSREDEERFRTLYLKRSRMFKFPSDASKDDGQCIFDCLDWLQDVLKEGRVRYPTQLSNAELQQLDTRQVLFRAFAVAAAESCEDLEGEFYPWWSNQARHQLCISPPDVLLTIAYMLAGNGSPSNIAHHADSSRLLEWAQGSLDWLKGLEPGEVFSRFIHHFIVNNGLHLEQESEPEETPSPVEGAPPTLVAPAALPEVVNPQDLLLSPRLADQYRLPAEFDTSY